jgi:hypothetical protein
MSGFVTDASATLPWCFADEATPWTEALLDRLQGGEEVLVPAHWPIEVMNGLAMAICVLRSKRAMQALLNTAELRLIVAGRGVTVVRRRWRKMHDGQ